MLRLIVDRRVLRAVICSLERHVLFGPQATDQCDRLAQPREPLLEVRPRHAGRGHFVQRFARAHAQHHAVREQHTQGRKHLRDHRRMVSEGRRQHAGPHHDPLRAGPQRSEPRQCGRCVPVRVFPRLKVIAHEHRIETGLFGEDREIQQFARPELFRRRLVSQSQHVPLLNCRADPPGSLSSHCDRPRLTGHFRYSATSRSACRSRSRKVALRDTEASAASCACVRLRRCRQNVRRR